MFLGGELTRDHWNFKCTGNSQKCRGRIRTKRAQLRRRVIDQTLHVIVIELASYDGEVPFCANATARARGDQFGHRPLILQQPCCGKTSIPNLGARLTLPLAHLIVPCFWFAAERRDSLGALALLGTSRRKVGSRQRLDSQSWRPASLGALALLDTSRRKVGSRQ